jgi:hypothetical protein
MGPRRDPEPIRIDVDLDPAEFAREANIGFEVDDEGELEDVLPEEEQVEPETPDDSDPEEGQPDDDGTGEAEGEEGDDETNEPEESEEDGAGDEELDPLAARARELGLGANFRTSEDVLKSHRHVLDALSRRDEDAVLGRALRERGIDPAQLDALDNSKAKPENQEPERGMEGWNPPVALDPAWQTSVKPTTDPETGEITGYEGPPDMVRDFTRYNDYRRSFWERTMDDPKRLRSVLDIDEIVDRRMKENRERESATARQEKAKAAANEFFEENREWIDQNGESFWPLVEQEGMHPVRAMDYLNLKAAAEKPPAGKDAKDNDLERARKRKTKRAAVTTTPIRKRKKAAEKNADEILGDALQSIPEEDRSRLGI